MILSSANKNAVVLGLIYLKMETLYAGSSKNIAVIMINGMIAMHNNSVSMKSQYHYKYLLLIKHKM